MANVTPNLAPMFYPGGISTTWTFGPNVDKVSYSVNDIPPAISEYIAYDTLTPANPFIAVTQDGKGNVVYDGGFPKFYNSSWNGATTFAGLMPAHKYLYNALNFCANAVKKAAGNKKVLILNDATSAGTYSIKSAIGTGFNTTLLGVMGVAGYTPTFKDSSNYPGGLVDASFAELDQYCLVIYFATVYDAAVRVTPRCIQDLATYREQGNGLILITDHAAGNYTSVQDALANGSGFVTDVNAIAANFGAWFSGDYNRSPVNVGFLRTNYGDHPLYAGMSNAEDIFAGGSESRVFVTTYTQYDPGAVPAIPVSQSGDNFVNFLLVMNDGSVETYRFRYTVISGQFLFSKDSMGSVLGSTHTTHKRAFDLDLNTNLATPPTMLGDIYKNNMKMGSFTFDGLNTTYKWIGGTDASFSIANGDVIKFKITSPWAYEIATTVTKVGTQAGVFNQAALRAQVQLNEYAALSRDDAWARTYAYAVKNFAGDQGVVGNLPLPTEVMGPVVRSVLGYLGPIRVPVYDTEAALLAGVGALVDKTTAALDAATGTIYLYVDGAWTKQPYDLYQMFGQYRYVLDTRVVRTFQILNANALTLRS